MKVKILHHEYGNDWASLVGKVVTARHSKDAPGVLVSANQLRLAGLKWDRKTPIYFSYYTKEYEIVAE